MFEGDLTTMAMGNANKSLNMKKGDQGTKKRTQKLQKNRTMIVETEVNKQTRPLLVDQNF